MSRSFSSFLTLETQSQREAPAVDYGLTSVVHDTAEDWGLTSDPVDAVRDLSDPGIPLPTLTPAPGL